MNRSIAKTRNELERITLKINQLKTKYTTDNIAPSFNNAESSPLSHSRYREKQFTREQREQPICTYPSKPSQIASSCKNSISVSLNSGEELYQREFKIFRNEIYNYIDKCLLLSKEREDELMERAMQECMDGSRFKKGRFSMEERIKKIQEETTNCLASIQDAILQIKKNEKYFNDKISHNEAKLRKQIKQLEEKIPKQKDHSTQIFHKIASAQKQIHQLKEEHRQNNVKIENLTEMIQEVSIKEENVEKRINRRIEEINHSLEQFSISKFNSLQDQLEKYSVFNVRLEKDIIGLRDQMEKNLAAQEKEREREKKADKFNESFAKRVQQIVNSQIEQVSNQIQNAKLALTKDFKMKLDSLTSGLGNLKQEFKNGLEERTNVLEQELSKNCSDIASVAETVLNLEQKTEEMSKLYDSFKQMLNQKLTQSDHNIVRFKSELEKRVEDIMASLSEIRTSISQTQLKTQQISVKLSQSPEPPTLELENNLKQIIYAEIAKVESKLEQEHSRHLVRIETVDTLLSQNEQRMKTSPQSEMLQEESQTQTNVPEDESKKNIEYVDEKLNQFQNDINETIKLLYEDIENKVNQMLGHTGMMEFRAQYEITKQNINELQLQVQQLVELFKSRQEIRASEPTSASSQDFQQLKEQIYSQIGNKVEQLSSIMERAIEEMEIKVEKLDHNFSYIYERMSSIEYDNANFKDKLTYLLAQREMERSPVKLEVIHTETRKETSNILDVLGQLNSGKKFFEG